MLINGYVTNAHKLPNSSTLDLPIKGTNSEVAGIFSAISNMNTENANKTVIPRVIFSPESGGSQNPNRLKIVNHKHGKMMLNR